MTSLSTNADLQNTVRPALPEQSTGFDRRHDLDALRAIAMLLGIVLHTALSFATIPWTVKDSRQSQIFDVLFSCIHGFRMPLFFMLSGFFTAMLWRKRGLLSLIKHRFKRIFLPLVLGCITIVPSMWAISSLVSRPSSNPSRSSPIFEAVVAGDIARVQSELQAPGININELDINSGSSPLCTAIFLGHTEISNLLIKAQADVDQPNRDMAAPLHIAVFMGRSEEAEMLLQANADQDARDGSGLTPKELLGIDFGTTNFLASSLGVPLEETTLIAGRRAIARQLGVSDDLVPVAGQSPGLAGLYGLLFQLPVFMHLWFLAFLCWLIAMFPAYTFIARALHIQNMPRWLVCSPVNLLWLVPLTLAPQSFMGTATFGPDSSIGLLPIPSVLLFYAVFFFFGAVYWEMNDSTGELGRWWRISLPVALFIVFPVGLDFVTGSFGLVTRLENEAANTLIANFSQVVFAWLMTFGSIGLCRRLLSRESSTMRYISDSSYWLYLAHLPLVLLAQWLVKDLEIPALLKFTGITIVITGFLLVTYEYIVRYTPIGRMLNGPRERKS